MHNLLVGCHQCVELLSVSIYYMCIRAYVQELYVHCSLYTQIDVIMCALLFSLQKWTLFHNYKCTLYTDMHTYERIYVHKVKYIIVQVVDIISICNSCHYFIAFMLSLITLMYLFTRVRCKLSHNYIWTTTHSIIHKYCQVCVYIY